MVLLLTIINKLNLKKMKTLKLFSFIVCLTLCNTTLNSFAQDSSKPVTQNKTFIGINAGLGPTFDYWWGDVYFSATGGIDLAFPISNNFAIGPYLSAGYDWCDETFIGNLGALAIVGENNKVKFMIGQGTNFQPDYECWGTSTRIGFTLPNNRIYLLGEFSTVLDYGELWSYSFLFHIGFNLGK